VDFLETRELNCDADAVTRASRRRQQTQARPALDESTEQPKSKRTKRSTDAPLTQNLKQSGHETTKTAKQKRSEKVDQKNNKGLIGASVMLSVVGMLNYMGNSKMPICT